MKKKQPAFSVFQRNLMPYASIYFGMIAGIVAGVLYFYNTNQQSPDGRYPDTKFGSFLAAQHAIYNNDFDNAVRFLEKTEGTDRALALFLAGKIDDSAGVFSADTSLSGRMAYAAYLVKKGDWKKLAECWKNEKFSLFAPIRIWSAVNAGKSAEALKFINSTNYSENWKFFARGQVYAETGKPVEARREFLKITTDFLNLNDYLYLAKFYKNAGFLTDFDELKTVFTSRPGGLFMSKFSADSNLNGLAFALVQTVSHAQDLITSDFSLVLLRLAETLVQDDAINYYLGNYFLETDSDFHTYFDRIPKSSPYRPFVLMKIGNLEKLVREVPLFLPSINKLVAQNMQQGRKKYALRLVQATLRQPNISKAGQGHLLKMQAEIQLARGRIADAQADISAARDLLPTDADILGLQARIWAANNSNLDEAYAYAIALVKRFPAEINNWNVLGAVVRAKEGCTAALEILERIGRVAESCSSLFEHLGDCQTGEKAKESYNRAIDLSDDGKVSIPEIRKKLRRLR